MQCGVAVRVDGASSGVDERAGAFGIFWIAAGEEELGEVMLASAERCGDPYAAILARSMALLLGPSMDPGVDGVDGAIELTERFAGWRGGGSLVQTSTLLNLALARTATDPAAAVAEVVDYVRLADRTGIDHWVTGAPMVAAHAASQLGSNDLAARTDRHQLSAHSYNFIGHAWVFRDTAAMLGDAGYDEDALSPLAMTRPEVLHTLAELQQRHPASSR